MRILITGNMGYVGPAVVSHLREHHPGAELVGFDAGLFASAVTTLGPAPETRLDAQHFGDVRDITAHDLAGCDAVVHLAAVSNDPIGNRFEAVTDAINRGASLRLAACARDAGVKNFVFASSCSVYGLADAGARRESDAVGPLTAYARSKVATEEGLRQMDVAGMTVTCLRFATACGISERLRLDLVLNDFVACALTSRQITVLSDGTPWRPLIDVADMARAIEWAVLRHVRSRAGGGWWSMPDRTRATIRCAISPMPSRTRCRAHRSRSTPRPRRMRAPTAWTSRCSANWRRRISRAPISPPRSADWSQGCAASASPTPSSADRRG